MSANEPRNVLPAGTAAPGFTLFSTPTDQLELRSLRGRPVVLAFYPADWSPVCGDQLSIYSHIMPVFEEYRAAVLGISVDGVWSHQAFVEARKLRFQLLSDYEPKGEIARRYGAYDYKDGCAQRALFVLDGNGTIAWSFLSPPELNPGADGILDALDALKQRASP